MSTHENPAALTGGRALVVAAFIAVGGLAVTTATQSTAAPVYAATQAEAGKADFKQMCAACHGADLAGAEGPQLAGTDFMTTWKGQTTKDLFSYAQGMPPGGPSLTTERYLEIVSYILQQNGAVAGELPLTEATAVPIGSIATGKKPQ